jgi:actin-like ATPase involved in cell morphogenesis
MPAIGIDFGTSCLRVGHVVDGAPLLVDDEEGRPSLLSLVAFHGGAVLTGEQARSSSSLHPELAVPGVKRLLGRSPEDPAVHAYAARAPFDVEIAASGVALRVGGDAYSPEDLTAMLLMDALGRARDRFEVLPTAAVLSAPIGWSERERAALQTAAARAGLTEIEVLSDAALAGIALAQRAHDERRVLVVEAGAGGVGAALLSVAPGQLVVLGSAGDTSAGGDDVEAAVVDLLLHRAPSWAAAALSTRGGVNLARRAAREILLDLAHDAEACAVLPPIASVAPTPVTITSQELLHILGDLLDRLSASIALALATDTSAEPSAVFATGGVMAQDLVLAHVAREIGRPVTRRLPLEAVAWGAALEAAMWSGELEGVLIVEALVASPAAPRAAEPPVAVDGRSPVSSEPAVVVDDGSPTTSEPPVAADGRSPTTPEPPIEEISVISYPPDAPHQDSGSWPPPAERISSSPPSAPPSFPPLSLDARPSSPSGAPRSAAPRSLSAGRSRALRDPLRGSLVRPATAEEVLALPISRSPPGEEEPPTSLAVLLARWLARSQVSGELVVERGTERVTLRVHEGRALCSKTERAALVTAIGWPSGTYAWNPQAVAAPGRGEASLHGIASEGLRVLMRAFSPDELEHALGERLERAPRLKPDRARLLGRAAISASEKRLIDQRFDGSAPARELAQHGGLGRHTTLVLLVMLELYDLVAWHEPELRAAPTLAERLAAQARKMEAANHFEAMGVHWSTPPLEIEAAYAAFVAKLRPGSEWYEAAPDACRAMQARLAAAQAVLGDEHARLAYRREAYPLDFESITDLMGKRATALSMRGAEAAAAVDRQSAAELRRTAQLGRKAPEARDDAATEREPSARPRIPGR